MTLLSPSPSLALCTEQFRNQQRYEKWVRYAHPSLFAVAGSGARLSRFWLACCRFLPPPPLLVTAVAAAAVEAARGSRFCSRLILYFFLVLLTPGHKRTITTSEQKKILNCQQRTEGGTPGTTPTLARKRKDESRMADLLTFHSRIFT
jgi:hypothetical protein